MADVGDYIKKTVSTQKVRPVLPFGAALEIGAVGKVQDDKFVRHGSINSILGMDVGETTTSAKADSWIITGGSDTSFGLRLAGEAATGFPDLPNASARVEVSFGSKSGFLSLAANPVVTTIKDPHLLIKSMLRAHKDGVWDEDYVLVYETVMTAGAVVLMSQSSNSGCLFDVSADADLGSVSIADLAGELKLNRVKNQVERFDGNPGLAQFFNAYRVKDGWFSKPKVEPFGLDAAPTSPTETVFDQV